MKDLYNFEHRWKLLDWIDESKLHWSYLSENPRGLYLLEKKIKDINWYFLSKNESAIYLLEKNQDKIIWDELAFNKSAIHLLKKKFNFKTATLSHKNTYLSGFIDYFLTKRYKKTEDKSEKIIWDLLSKNESAIDILEKDYDKINWHLLCRYNKNAKRIFDMISLPENYHIIKKINECNDLSLILLSDNPSAISVLEKYPEIINWKILSKNPSAIHLLEKNPDKINWEQLSANPSAIHLLEQNLDKIDWKLLSTNSSAMNLLQKNIHQLNECQYCWLSYNPCAIDILEKYPEVINWESLSANINAIHLLEKNQDKIYWMSLSSNPAIFELDYDFFVKRMNIIREELLEKAWHPSRFQKWCLSFDEMD